MNATAFRRPGTGFGNEPPASSEPGRLLDFAGPMDARSPIHAELDRVGASLHKASACDYVSVQLGIDEVKAARPAARAPAPNMARP
jgi:hypothetical protein